MKLLKQNPFRLRLYDRIHSWYEKPDNPLCNKRVHMQIDVEEKNIILEIEGGEAADRSNVWFCLFCSLVMCIECRMNVINRNHRRIYQHRSNIDQHCHWTIELDHVTLTTRSSRRFNISILDSYEIARNIIVFFCNFLQHIELMLMMILHLFFFLHVSSTLTKHNVIDIYTDIDI